MCQGTHSLSAQKVGGNLEDAVSRTYRDQQVDVLSTVAGHTDRKARQTESYPGPMRSAKKKKKRGKSATALSICTTCRGKGLGSTETTEQRRCHAAEHTSF